ncbi:S1C family serine protease [Arthrobacter sp. SDTb3-6]|uniref:S1C family serine protease n=1 Tax=Arthrobacter sp. SDTb3-6 TaxID=2713571 RepID=UPI0021097700|nr:trypsin-like peptidase domain-containing protein [Arthrobacter sp. SDTb3-6]
MQTIGRTIFAAVMAAGLMAGTAGCTAVTTHNNASAPPSGATAPAPSSPASGPPSASAPATGTGSGPANEGLPAVPAIVQKIEPAVVTIQTQVGLGSGVVYRSDGTIVTDAHVVEDSQKQPFTTVQVQFADGKQASARVLGVDNVDDVAVIRADRTGLPVPTFASTPPVVGSLCVVIGSPLGLDNTVTAGIISGLHRDIPPSSEAPEGMINLIQTDAPISPGNSGGAVSNGQAQVIGLSEAYLPPSSGAVAIGFVTPASTVTVVADQLLKNGTVKHAFLGVSLSDISPQTAQEFRLPTTNGALVINVASGGPAAAAGMKPGDVITRVGSTPVNDVTDLVAALRADSPGQRINVTVQRGSTTTTLEVTLGNTPAATQ